MDIKNNKLYLIEEAEKDGYINKCPKCGSYKIAVNKGPFTSWGDIEESYADYYCDSCSYSW